MTFKDSSEIACKINKNLHKYNWSGEKELKILVVDGMGGGIGKAIVETLKKNDNGIDCEILAVGTNSLATAAMLKAGADDGATGENAVVYNAERATFIIGPMGIIIGNSMHGEISPAMAAAISCSDAHKILLPVSKCNASILGITDGPLSSFFPEMISILKSHKGE